MNMLEVMGLFREKSQSNPDSMMHECPFCGEIHDLIVTYDDLDMSYYVECDGCGARGPYVYPEAAEVCNADPETMAIDNWNGRLSDNWRYIDDGK